MCSSPGADAAIDLLAALPHVKKWKRAKEKLKVAGPMVLFGSERAGNKLAKNARCDVNLPKGSYAIETTELEGKTDTGHEVMAQFVRLMRA